MKIYFFLGKGGVGKSTLSALTALYVAKKSKQVLLTSLDPAHNLADIFNMDFSDKATPVLNNFNIIETDHEKWIKTYLKKTEQLLTASYSYLTTFSMEKHFGVMQYAPALEEYALHQAFLSIVGNNNNLDVLIFDMPPTALALKFFALPQLSLLWLDNLVNLRNEILKKQEVITKLSLGAKTFERDRVIQNLKRQQEYWSSIDHLLKNDTLTQCIVVENPDDLSQKESKRIIKKMLELGMSKPVKALNKSTEKVVKGYLLTVDEQLNISGLNNLEKAVNNIDFSKLLKI